MESKRMTSDLASLLPCLLPSLALPPSPLSFSSLFFVLGSFLVEQQGRIRSHLSRTKSVEPQDKMTVRLKSKSPRT